LDFFSGSVCVHTFDFPAKDPERRRWAYADEDDAVWTVDGSGRVERLSQNNDLLRSALDGDPSTWRLIVARDRVIAVGSSQSALGASWRVNRRADGSNERADGDQEGRLVASATDLAGERVYLLRRDALAAVAARLEVIDPISWRLVSAQTLPGCGDPRSL